MSKVVVSTLVAAALLGAPVIVYAQTEPQATPPKTHHTTKSSHMKSGTTTGMSPTGSHYGQGKARPGGASTNGKPAGS